MICTLCKICTVMQNLTKFQNNAKCQNNPIISRRDINKPWSPIGRYWTFSLKLKAKAFRRYKLSK